MFNYAARKNCRTECNRLMDVTSRNVTHVYPRANSH